MNLDPATITQAIIIAALVGLVTDHFRLRGSVGDLKVAVANLRTHMAENYVRSPEVQRLSDEMANLRHTVEEAVKLLHEIKGAQNPR